MILWILCLPVSFLLNLLPVGVQRGIGWMVGWLLRVVVRYRIKIVRENLSNAFPDYTSAQIRDIEKKFYVHLGDICLEMILMASFSQKDVRERMDFRNAEYMETDGLGRSLIAMVAHYGSWELTSTYGIHSSRHEDVFAAYRPLKNKIVDGYFMKCRTRFKSTPVPMSDIAVQIFSRRRSPKGVVVALIADQAPPRDDKGKWFEFMRQPTQFFIGGERLAVKLKMPVYYTRIKQVSRGFYTADFEKIYDPDTESGIQEYEITRRYVRMLEAQIRECPQMWLWSHRRWKRKPLADLNANQLIEY